MDSSTVLSEINSPKNSWPHLIDLVRSFGIVMHQLLLLPHLGQMPLGLNDDRLLEN